MQLLLTPRCLSLQEVYEKFWALHKNTKESELFIACFEFVHGKTFSEVICESICSIMNMATSSRPILHPSNFAKEIFLRFNLPSVYTLIHNMVQISYLTNCLIKRSLSGEQIQTIDSYESLNFRTHLQV